MHDLLALKGLSYLRYEYSVFGWSTAVSLRDGGTIYHLASTDGEVTVVAVDYMDADNAATYKEFETLSDAIKYLQSAVDKS